MMVNINGNMKIMKKLTQLLTTLIATFGLVLLPSIAMAQDVPTVEVETTTPTTTSTTSTTAGVPETGIAPKPSNLLRNSAVFIVGATVGTAIGIGIVTLKRHKSQSNQ